MDSRIRGALERIANECDIGEHTEIARKALLTAEPEPCEDTTHEWDALTKEEMWNEIQDIRRLVDSDGTKSICSDIEAYASQVADKRAEEDQAAHEAIASICFAAGVETPDGTSVGAVRNLAKRAEELRAQVGRLRDELDYSERRLTTSYQSSQSLREEVAQLKELLEEYRQELIKAKEALAATEPKPSAKESQDAIDHQ